MNHDAKTDYINCGLFCDEELYSFDNIECRSLMPSKHSAANVLFTWEEQNCAQGQTKVLTEFQVLKHLVCALDHPRDCVLFRTDGSVYKPRSGICISSCSPPLFYKVIEEFCPLINAVETLETFIADIKSLPSTDLALPNAYYHYCIGLRLILTELRELLCCVESKISESDNTYTLDNLCYDLSPWKKILPALSETHTEAVYTCWKAEDNWKCSVRLLAVILKNITSRKYNADDILLRLFLLSIRPYFEVLDRWLSNHNPIDPKNEFLITRHSYEESIGVITIRDYSSLLINFVPKTDFFDNIVYLANRACSSVDFLVLLGKDSRYPLSNGVTLFDEFLFNFINYLRVCPKECIESSPFFFSDFGRIEIDYNNKRTASLTDCFESLDDKNLRSVSMGKYSFRYSLDLNQGNLDYITPEILLQRCLTKTVSNVMQAKGFAKDILLTDFSLKEHLTVLKDVYLFQDSYKMVRFCNMLFERVNVSDFYYISESLELEEILSETSHRQIYNFSLNVSPFVLGNRSLVLLLDSLTIDYNRLPPLNLIIRNAAIDKYNEIFRLLIKTKWAHRCLLIPRLKHVPHNKEGTNISRLYSIRIFLLHTLLTLDSYFLNIFKDESDGSILDVCSIARDVHIIASALEKKLDKFRKYCFLLGGRKCGHLIQSLFSLCEEFEKLWSIEIQTSVTRNVLDSLENRYQEVMIEFAENLSELPYKDFSPFTYLCDEIMHNMPGNWDNG